MITRLKEPVGRRRVTLLLNPCAFNNSLKQVKQHPLTRWPFKRPVSWCDAPDCGAEGSAVREAPDV